MRTHISPAIQEYLDLVEPLQKRVEELEATLLLLLDDLDWEIMPNNVERSRARNVLEKFMTKEKRIKEQEEFDTKTGRYAPEHIPDIEKE